MAMSSSYTLRNKRVWVAGDRGLVGSALVRRLQREGCELLTAPRESVDLRRPDQVERWMQETRPQAVFLAAARVGGIYANDTRPAEFIYDNLMIQSNVVEASRRVGVEKLMLLARLASIRGWRRSPSRRARCSPGRSSPPTSGMPSPRSPASSSARPIAASTAVTSSPSCRPT